MTAEFESEVRDMCNLSKALVEQGIEQGIEQGSEKKELEMYQKMMDKGFGIKAIASIFSVSEESVKKLLMKA